MKAKRMYTPDEAELTRRKKIAERNAERLANNRGLREEIVKHLVYVSPNVTKDDLERIIRGDNKE